MFSFYDLFEESTEDDFDTNIFLEDEFDIDTSLDDMPKVDDQSPQADQQAQKAVSNDAGEEDNQQQQQDDSQNNEDEQDQEGEDGGEEVQDPQENPENGSAPPEEADEPVEANTDIFSSLTSEEQAIKILELQKLYSQLYNSCNDISKRINDLDTDESDIAILARVSDSVNLLKKYIEDYLSYSFTKKSFVENDIMYNRFLAILSSITSVLQELSKSKENTERNDRT